MKVSSTNRVIWLFVVHHIIRTIAVQLASLAVTTTSSTCVRARSASLVFVLFKCMPSSVGYSSDSLLMIWIIDASDILVIWFVKMLWLNYIERIMFSNSTLEHHVRQAWDNETEDTRHDDETHHELVFERQVRIYVVSVECILSTPVPSNEFPAPQTPRTERVEVDLCTCGVFDRKCKVFEIKIERSKRTQQDNNTTDEDDVVPVFEREARVKYFVTWESTLYKRF